MLHSYYSPKKAVKLKLLFKKRKRTYFSTEEVEILSKYFKIGEGSRTLTTQECMGLSYKQIGRKLGIDPHKEEVIQVYKSLGTDKVQQKFLRQLHYGTCFLSECQMVELEVVRTPAPPLPHPEKKT